MSGLVLLRGASALISGRLETADVLLDGSQIAEVKPTIDAPESSEVRDLAGFVLAPGFIDVHVHGGGGFSLLSDDPTQLADYSRWVVSRGVTSFLATICASDVDHGVVYAEAAADAGCDGAAMLGINFEGPFVSSVRRGALPKGWLTAPDLAILDRLLRAAPVRVISIAPELDGAFEVIEAALKAGVCVSVGHTDATYEVSKQAFDAGASHVTHAFNAMRPLHHRAPGPIGAAIEASHVTVEAIADGVHLHPATVRLLAEALGTKRLCLVTDAVTPAGLPEGSFRIGAEEAALAGGAIRLPDGTIAGSASTMDAVVRNVVDWGIGGAAAALEMASATPARAFGFENRKGRIAAGYDADLVVLSRDLAVRETWVGGQCVYKSEEA